VLDKLKAFLEETKKFRAEVRAVKTIGQKEGVNRTV
jgi:hypothetical protein